MTLTRSSLLVIVAVGCFAVALLLALDAFAGNFSAWVAGGLLAFAAAHLP